jgi:hypothetical protein
MSELNDDRCAKWHGVVAWLRKVPNAVSVKICCPDDSQLSWQGKADQSVVCCVVTGQGPAFST